MLGDSAMSLVAGIWVKSLTGSRSVAGLVSACVYPPSLFGPAGGMIADRVHRQRLLIRVNLASALVLRQLPAAVHRRLLWAAWLFRPAWTDHATRAAQTERVSPGPESR